MGYDADVIVVFGIRITKEVGGGILKKLFPDLDKVMNKSEQQSLWEYACRKNCDDIYEAWTLWDADIELGSSPLTSKPYRMVTYCNGQQYSGTFITFSTVSIHVLRGPEIFSKEFEVPSTSEHEAFVKFLDSIGVENDGSRKQYLVISGG